MGVVVHSYGIRGGQARRNQQPFNEPRSFVAFCAERGAGGVQMGLGVRDSAAVADLRETIESRGMYIEGSCRLPQDAADVERFDQELKTAAAVGARIVRVAVLSGRRYETFETWESFREFTDRAYQSIRLAEPVAKKHGVRLAIENHKDWRIDDLLRIMRHFSSEQLGICLDTGNSIALLEDPYAVVEAYAPFTLTTHIKDMGVEEYADGFLLSEVPLGTGFLDLSRIIATIRKPRSDVRWNLEMITRDPLKVPCLTEKYWATFDKLPARELAAMLALVRREKSDRPLPRVNPLPLDEQIKTEDDNVRASLAWSAVHLG